MHKYTITTPKDAIRLGPDGTGDVAFTTSIQGYVWREAGPTDHVCVPPETRRRRPTITPRRQIAA